MNELGNTLSEEGHFKEAESVLRQTLDIQTRVLGPEHPDTAATKYNLACNAALAGHSAEALTWLRDAIAHGLSMLNVSRMTDDTDLVSLHGNTEFEAMIATANKQIASAKK